MVYKEDFLNFKVGFDKGEMDFVIPTKNFMGQLSQMKLKLLKQALMRWNMRFKIRLIQKAIRDCKARKENSYNYK